jgi:LuxR family transcriptional regulator, maltose regulon positive regulatory protein
MSKNTPLVRANVVHFAINGQKRTLPLDTTQWYDWLETATTFAFESAQGTFTARKEPASNGRGGNYWRAYRKREGKLHRVYLGKSAELNNKWLEEVARRLNETETEAEVVPPAQVDTPVPQSLPAISGTPLIATKLLVPTLPDTLVARPRLFQKLEEAYPLRKLLVISGPAGFGKTTCVVEWLQQHQKKSGEKVGWLALDDNDNEPVRFWSYFLAAFQPVLGTVSRQLINQLRSPQPPSLEELLATLINEFSQLDQPLILVLDDYHAITNPAIHEHLAFLLNHQPRRLHLVITTRYELSAPFPLARMRLRGQLVELHTADLKFIPAETSQFLNIMNLKITPADIAALEKKTEGWVGALKLAATLMQSYSDSAAFIKAFNGQQRFLLDYLAEEVFHQQPPDIQHLLLQTSLVERFNGVLVEELTGCEDGYAALKKLEQANLFLLPLEDAPGWFRYHSLFQCYLRNRLTQEQVEHLPLLHQWAARWFETHQMPAEAIEHWLAINAYDQATRLIELSLPLIYERNEQATLLRWLENLPPEMAQRFPQIDRPKLSEQVASISLAVSSPAVKPHRNNVMPVPTLTERERTILRLLIKTSLSSTEIADELVIAVSTVRTHIKNIYSKLEVQNRIQAIARCAELDIG